MNRIDLPHLVWALENLAEGRVVNRIQVDPEVAHWARVGARPDARAARRDRTTPPADTQPRTAVVSGAGLVLAAVVSVQVGAALAKNLFDTLGAPGVVWLRLGIAALVLVVAWRPWPWRSGRRWGRATVWHVVAFGLVIAAMNSTFYLSLARIPLGIAVTVEFIGPLALAAVLSRRWLDALWVLLALSGILLLVKADGATHLDTVGVLLAAIAGIFWAGYIVLSSKVGEKVPGGSGLAAALVISAVVTTPPASRPCRAT